MTDSILFLDTEVGVYSEKIHNIGVLLGERRLQGSSIAAVKNDIKELKYDFVCGHNFIKHDKKYLELTSLNQIINTAKIIDTLYLSMLLYPNQSTHKLGKPYKTQINIENDPIGDCGQTKELLLLLKAKFESMSDGLQSALYTLLGKHEYFYAFFEAFDFYPKNSVDIFEYFAHRIKCSKEKFTKIQHQNPIELAFVLSWLSSGDKASISKITLINFPKIRTIIEALTFSIESTDLGDFAKNEFSIEGFRSFPTRDSSLFKRNEISQEDIVLSALNKKSLLAILPTGGGKTFTFQLPALIKAKAYKGLTVVISPLQALMKNHVDSFNAKNQNFKVAAISGYLSPIERMNTLEEVRRGIVDILYLAPEALRSNSIFGALSSRMIERFVIDEAHCFSTWGHDFRHDYKYIATFIKELQNSQFQNDIPVSCFTATAKPDVLEDIKSYFEDKLDIKLTEHIASSERTNLKYKAVALADEKAKYQQLVQEILRLGKKPIIIYRPQSANGCKELAEKLQNDERLFELDIVIEPFYAKIDKHIEDGKRNGRNKSEILNDFIDNRVNIVVATTAFGMGIDKPDIQAVIHYDPSDSIESYMQEAGRGARKEELSAECIVFFSDNDFAKSFSQLNRTKIEYAEIKSIVDKLKQEFRNKDKIHLSPKQIAEKIGIDTEDSGVEYETIIKTAILELEERDILNRNRNKTNIYATSLRLSKEEPMEYVHSVLDPKKELYAKTYEYMILTMQNIIQRSKMEPVELDNLADTVGIDRRVVFQVIADLQNEKLLEFNNDITVFVKKDIQKELAKHFEFESAVFEYIKTLHQNNINSFNLRELNEFNSKKTQNSISWAKKIIQSWSHLSKLKANIFKASFKKDICHFECADLDAMEKLVLIRRQVCFFVANRLLEELTGGVESEIEVSANKMFLEFTADIKKISLEGFHHALVYMHDILDAFKLRRGRLIYYQAFELDKLAKLEERTPYKKLDYNSGLKEYYERKIEGIHILIEFFQKLMKDGWEKSKAFVRDYFAMDYRKFKKKYGFDNNAKLPATMAQLEKILKDLNSEQNQIFEDKTSNAVLVLAGPGSGKTKTLAHKIASLITIENNKPEYFLMLAHSRVAVSEFRDRLKSIVGNLAYSVDIYTFHAYAAHIVGKKMGDEGSVKNIIESATQMLKNGQISIPLKSMLVLDEYQDVGQKTYEFIKAVHDAMPKGKKIIAVGDDDQCINDFGDDKADTAYMGQYEINFGDESDEDEGEEQTQVKKFKKYALVTNYRSAKNIVDFANEFAQSIPNRLKTERLKAHKTDNGKIEIVKHKEKSSMLAHILDAVQNDNSESIAILLRNNEHVLTMYSLLLSHGIKAKYISNKDGFSLGDLDELRSFFEYWNEEKDFEKAKARLDTEFQGSKNLKLAHQVVDKFEDEHEEEIKTAQNHYLLMFKEYLREISFDEFEDAKARIVVSTMHKSKGKEFESVYVGVEPDFVKNGYDTRLLYVAITRAKTNLYINVKDGILGRHKHLVSSYRELVKTYKSPSKIVFMMSLADIFLSSEESERGISATKPKAGEGVLITKHRESFKISKNGVTIALLSRPSVDRLSQKILNEEQKGYTLLNECQIEYVVRWKDKKDSKTYKQVLCMVEMERPAR